MEVLNRSVERARSGEGRGGGARAGAAKGKRAKRTGAQETRSARAGKGAKDTKGAGRAGGSRTGRRTRAARQDLAGLGEKELYARATDLGIPGRSTMKRDELLEALTAADRTAA